MYVYTHNMHVCLHMHIDIAGQEEIHSEKSIMQKENWNGS